MSKLHSCCVLLYISNIKIFILTFTLIFVDYCKIFFLSTSQTPKRFSYREIFKASCRN